METVSRELRRSEALAKAVVEIALPGTRIDRHDDGSEEAAYDFDIVFPDGHTEALEVTESTQGDRRALRSAMRGRAVSEVGTVRSWEVRFNVSVHIKDARQAMVPLLHELERSGQTELFLFHSADVFPDPTISALVGLGVDSLLSWAPRDGEPAQMVLEMPGDGGVISPALVVEALLDEAQKPDNLRKLERATTDERHLFVWVDSEDQFPVSLAMQRKLPVGPTVLPPPVTCGWVASAGPDRFVCWRVRPPAGWEALDVRQV